MIIIHDLSGEALSQLSALAGNATTIDANAKAAHCVGCFGCWLKTPGECVIKDAFQHVGATIAQADKLVIISEICYGGYSASVKKLLDRSISLSLPFLTYRGGKTHHSLRYETRPDAMLYLYGNASENERRIASELAQANMLNFGWNSVKQIHIDNPLELKEVWE